MDTIFLLEGVERVREAKLLGVQWIELAKF